MKIREIAVHNYRSFKNETLHLTGYSLLIGANNCGKSSMLDVLRTFYDKDIKFDHQRDFPKFKTDDEDSWIEIEFQMTKEEAESIRAEYRQDGDRFRVRRVLHSPDKTKLHLYGYEAGA